MADQQPQQQQAQQGQQQGQRKFGGGQRQGRGKDEQTWKPVTKLGRLVSAGKIKSLDDIFRMGIPIKESQIVDHFLASKENKVLKEEVIQVKPVQKQTQAGQRTRFKSYVVIGDGKQHIGLGWKCHKEVQGAIKGAIEMAKLNIIPVRNGYWGNAIGDPHTVPIKIYGKCGSIRCRLIPAPRGSGLVACPAAKKVLQFAGVQDVYTSTSGSTKTKGNFAKAVFYALQKTFHYLTPDLWGKPAEGQHYFDEYSQWLNQKPEVPQQRQQRDQNDRGQQRRYNNQGNRRAQQQPPQQQQQQESN